MNTFQEAYYLLVHQTSQQCSTLYDILYMRGYQEIWSNSTVTCLQDNLRSMHANKQITYASISITLCSKPFVNLYLAETNFWLILKSMLTASFQPGGWTARPVEKCRLLIRKDTQVYKKKIPLTTNKSFVMFFAAWPDKSVLCPFSLSG